MCLPLEVQTLVCGFGCDSWGFEIKCAFQEECYYVSNTEI